MYRGKKICEVLKAVRLRIAQANDIRYVPQVCTHEGECRGTCPACETEVRYLEHQLDMRRALGKAVVIAGIGAALFPSVAQAQNPDTLVQKKQQVTSDTLAGKKFQISDDDILFGLVEENAQFPGGDTACKLWIQKHMRYPREARKKGIEGRVIVKFVVQKNGSVGEVEIHRSPNALLDAEALRLVKSMPKWKPARQGAKCVESRFLLPIEFKLH